MLALLSFVQQSRKSLGFSRFTVHHLNFKRNFTWMEWMDQLMVFQ